MKNTPRLIGLSAILLLFPAAMPAHCDTTDGPVVTAAREAFAKGDVTPVLKWVKAADEAEIKSAFVRAATVRRQSPDAAQLAETWFFETLVRMHRAGEGAPYTGLKTESVVEPGIAAADAALETGGRETLLKETIIPLQATLEKKYEHVSALRAHANDNVAAGRDYVAAYVDYIHFAERLAALGASQPGPHEEHVH
jgi:hypothetical protein